MTSLAWIYVFSALAFFTAGSMFTMKKEEAAVGSLTLDERADIPPIAAERMKMKNQIAYKRAWLFLTCIEGCTDSCSEKTYYPLMGVGVDNYYHFEDTALSVINPFHSFYDLDDALKHTQDGNVFLEVINSGTLSFHELGMHAEKQRVLQLLFRDCSICKSSTGIEAWQRVNHPRQRKQHSPGFLVFCGDCAPGFKGSEPIATMADYIKKHTGYELVTASVASSGDQGSFIPTPTD